MRILITGSSGRIGSVLRDRLAGRGHTIVDFDSAVSWSLDIRAPGCLAPFLPSDLIIHLAALSSVKACQGSPSLAVDVNVTGTRNVLQEAEKSGSRAVLFVSSCEVYGDATTLPVAETASIRPINVYGRTKAIAEDLAADARRRKIATAIVRLPSVYGSVGDADSMIGGFCRAAVEGGALHTLDVQRTFDFLHVDDAAEGLALTAELLLSGREKLPVFHLATGHGTSIGTAALLAHELAAKAGLAVKMTRGYAERWEVSNFIGNPSRARRVLNWEPKIAFDVGFRRLAAETLKAAQEKSNDA